MRDDSWGGSPSASTATSSPIAIVGATSAGSGNLRPLDGFGSADDLAEPGISDVPVPPGDVAADHAGLLAVGVVVGAVEGEVVQRGELRLDPVEPGVVERHVSEFEVFAATHTPTRRSVLVDRCGLKLSSTIAMRFSAGCSERR